MTTRVSEKVDLNLSVKDVHQLQLGNTPDTFAVLYEEERASHELVPLGRTELVRNHKDPEWSTQLTVDYAFERVQTLVVKVFQEASPGKSIADESQHKFIGSARFTLAELMRNPLSKVSINLQDSANPGSRGSLTVRGEPRHDSLDKLEVTFSGQNLVPMNGLFGKSDPYLKIYRMNEDGEFSAVWTGPTITNTLNPVWPVEHLYLSTLCNGDYDRPLRIDVIDANEHDADKPMGSVETSVRDLLASDGQPLDVIEKSKRKQAGYVNSGTLIAGSCKVDKQPNFAEFIMAGGCELSMIVAVDFTASNGVFEEKSSLHYLDPNGGLNQYQQVITSIGSVLEHYDTDKKFPLYGFGASLLQPDGTYSPADHCFPLKADGVEVEGVSGILEAYKQVQSRIRLSGPTIFAPLIKQAAKFAQDKPCNQTNQNYTILVILTDGVINDMPATKTAVIEASELPLSIIIVGVGSADFDDMTDLDSDNKLLSHRGKEAKRDIVHFVPFSEFASKGADALARDVLTEVPTQFLQYMKANNIVPKKA